MDESKDPGSEEKKETPEVEAVDLETARGDWMVAERRQRARILIWVAAGALFVVLAFTIWWVVFRLPSIPIGCEAAIQRLQTHCKLSRREAINTLKNTKALVPDDPTRRETCRVLATAEHRFWRPRAIKALLGHINKQAASRPRPKARPADEPARPPAETRPEPRPEARPEPRPEARPEPRPETRPEPDKPRPRPEEALPEPTGQKISEDKSRIPIPKVIKADGPLSDAAWIYVEKRLIPDFIKRTYCPKRR